MADRGELAIMDRMLLLLSKLKGDPLIAVESLGSNEQSYEKAWQILDGRYDNQRMIVEKTLTAIQEAPATSNANAAALMAHLQQFETSLHNIETLELDFKTILIFLSMQKLDPITLGRFEDALGCTNRMPTVTEYTGFLEKEYAVTVRQAKAKNAYKKPLNGQQTTHQANNQQRFNRQPSRVHFAATEDIDRRERLRFDDNRQERKTVERRTSCFICDENHATVECRIFLASHDRAELLIKHKVCIYCVKHKHNARQKCRAREGLQCSTCGERHLDSMHDAFKAFAAKKGYNNNNDQSRVFLAEKKPGSGSDVILPTAIVKIITKESTLAPVRCLIDQCSQANYITEDLVQKLRLRKKKTEVQFKGVGDIIGTVNALVHVSIQLNDGEQLKFKALVVKRAASKLPTYPAHVEWKIDEMNLADPLFNRPAAVQLILGGKLAPSLFLKGLEVKDNLLLQETRLGWIVTGQSNKPKTSSKVVSTHVSLIDFEASLMKFWDMPFEEQETAAADEEENYCEKLFQMNHFRTPDGRYVVPTPWKPDAPQLGSSYRQAVRFYLGQEHRWHLNSKHKEMSDAFMQEYINLGHMTEVPRHLQQDESSNTFYIPYLSIIRTDSITTKLRNVFNASAKSSNGVTLNDQIFKGPTLLTKITDVVTTMRNFRYVYSSDVKMMYRQILINEEDSRKLRILWRPNRSAPLKEYQMRTVSYGVIAAPWQAIRVLHQIADDNSPDEETAKIIKKAFYMDDLFHGADTLEQCWNQINNISSTLEAGKLPLTKWMANDERVLIDVEENQKMKSYVDLSKHEATVKTLGLMFNPQNDEFSFNPRSFTDIRPTKRGYLSASASLYDPLGWALPLAMNLRISMQTLWAQGLDWDDVVDEKTKKKFDENFNNIHLLAKIKIPRWTGGLTTESTELVAFSDASADGYAAVVFSRVKNGSSIVVRLIAGRGRVTPLKSKKNSLVTIPKLELEGILLATELCADVQKSFVNSSIVAYTDSEICIAWVRNQKGIDNKFVARRVAKIRKRLGPEALHYVKSAENPADPASRGLTIEKFVDCDLWFNGPHWLQDDVLPKTPFTSISNAFTIASEEMPSILERYSSWRTLLRVVATCLRFKTKEHGPITATETATAFQRIVIAQQTAAFKEEIKLIKKGKTLPKKHWMKALCPFFDGKLLRVGGRLDRANLPNERKHPMLLAKSHVLDLYITHIHLENGHAGVALTTRIINELFWVPALAPRIRKCIRSCNTCTRWKAETLNPKMGNLPAVRVNPSPVFSNCGVDLAGHFFCRPSRLKFEKEIKTYVALFICMTTKVVHLEMIMDLTTENFLAAFSRFSARRGCPAKVFSDRGTNFVGSDKVLQRQWERILDDVKIETATQHVDWEFSPPGSPNFGGLWESNIKMMKFFLKRMQDVHNLTAEEFGTLLCRVEAILNSRPLYPSSLSPNDEPALTPYHFAIQRTFKLNPFESITIDSTPLTKRWLLVRQLQQQLWEKFQVEYLIHLQKRNKQTNPTRNLMIDDIVLLEDHTAPPTAWKLGRVLEIFPDKAGSVRVVDLKTAKKETVLRASSRLVPLFPEAETTNGESDDVGSHDDKQTKGNSLINVQAAKDASEEPETKSVQEDSQDDIADPPVRPPRRSARLAGRSAATTALLTLLTICLCSQPTGGVNIQSLAPGIHIARLGNATVRTADLALATATSVNITEDTLKINKQISELGKFCASYHENYTAIMQACKDQQNALSIEASNVFKGIYDGYNEVYQGFNYSHESPHRSRRGFGAAAKFVATYVAPMAITTGAIAYQQLENNHLKEQMKEVKAQMNKMTQAIVGASDIEFTDMESALNHIIDTQNEMKLRTQTNTYIEKIQLMISNFQAKHQNIVNEKPLKQLEKKLGEMKDDLHDLMLPPLKRPEDIFTINAIKKSLRNGIVVLHFSIPMVMKTIYTEFAIIAAPTDEGEVVLMDDDKLETFRTISELIPNCIDIKGALAQE